MTHLTIDLDYFIYPSSESCYDEGVALLSKIKSLKVPLIVKRHHHHILPYINKYKFDKIINVDYHSDIVHDILLEDDDTKLDLNCGTWANFYKHRESCIFEWRHPVKKMDFTNLCDASFKGLNKKYINYFDVFHRFGFSKIPEDLHSVSIALSKDYCDYDLYQSIVGEFDWLYHGYKENVK